MVKGGGEGGLSKDEMIAQLMTDLRQCKVDLESEVKERKKLERESDRQQKQCNDLEASLASDREKHVAELELIEAEHAAHAGEVEHDLEAARHQTLTRAPSACCPCTCRRQRGKTASTAGGEA